MAKQGIFLKITLTGIICLIVIAFVLFNTRLIVKGPEITNLSIYDGQVFDENLIEISGKAENISIITMNDRRIFIDEDKNFNEEILLSNKINPIHIYTEDKFGKKEEIKVNLIYRNNLEEVNLAQKTQEIKMAREKEVDENEEIIEEEILISS